jgi:hypothetical protein
MVVCRQHTHPTTNPTLQPTTNQCDSTPYYKPASNNMSSSSNLPPTYKHVLLRDRPAHTHTVDPRNPRSRLAGHPLAPFITVPQPTPAEHELGTTLDPFHGRGLQTPLVLAAPRSNIDLGHGADFTARTIGSRLLTCQYSIPPQLCQLLVTWSLPAGID